MISFLKFHPERLLFPKADIQITKKWAKSRSAFGQQRSFVLALYSSPAAPAIC